MSTTRPLPGMKRNTEVNYAVPPGNSHSPTPSRPTAESLTVDEFTVNEDRETELKCTKPRVEKVFQVAFTIIGLLDHTGAHGSKDRSRQIWLQLKGKKEDVAKAKEFVKGLCDPELQKEERYPVDMHCIFAGARGLFLDRLLRDTSAEVQVLEPGRLRLLGRAEAVVMAQSRILQFVTLFQEKRSLPADREPLVKRTFKTFVEERADKYTMELLLLPSPLKEELLGLVQSPTQVAAVVDLEQDRSQTSTPVTELSNRILVATFEDRTARPTPTPDVVVLNGRPTHKRRSSESEQRDTKRQYSLERRDEEQDREKQYEASQTRTKTPAKGTQAVESIEILDEGEAVSPETNLRCLVNFFRNMGYQQEVVERVVRETGQTEDTYLLLERIVQESQKSPGTQGVQYTSGYATDSSPSANTSTISTSTSTYARAKEKEWVPEWGPERVPERMPERVPELVLERLPGRALTEIKSKENIRVPSSNGFNQKRQQAIIVLDEEEDEDVGRKSRTVGPQDLKSDSRFGYLSRGGSQTVGRVPMETVTMLRSSSQGPPVTETRPGCSYQTIAGRVLLPRPEPPVTGLSRFQQSLQTPYKLVLQNEPGRPGLRHIIIDGSNVAMAHGLHRMFSCRGIAIAVEAFWRRGHREITVFVPQWRQKKDPTVTEQHFLNQLEDLRLLSFTPSREVCGQRISSHDDRFLLHLAEKTGGIIVTNDNMRDFVKQSEAWMQIIQERLLQFTFVGDHFMIPDDPLGRHGPHLEHFLRKDSQRSPMADLQVIPMTYSQTLPSATHSPFSSQPRQPSHWPHSGPPDWHPPRPSSSPPPSQRSPLETTELKRKLYDIFPDHKQRIDRILNDNPYMRDLNALSGLLLG